MPCVQWKVIHTLTSLHLSVGTEVLKYTPGTEVLESAVSSIKVIWWTAPKSVVKSFLFLTTIKNKSEYHRSTAKFKQNDNNDESKMLKAVKSSKL